MTKRRWLIVSADGLFWTINYGWGESVHLATAFSDEQQAAHTLPPQGAWREMEDTLS